MGMVSVILKIPLTQALFNKDLPKRDLAKLQQRIKSTTTTVNKTLTAVIVF